jgi:hypothetical protein
VLYRLSYRPTIQKARDGGAHDTETLWPVHCSPVHCK